MDGMIFFATGGTLLFLLVAIYIRFPLIGASLIAISLFVPLPAFICPYLTSSPQCGSISLFSINLENDLPIFWRVYLVVLTVVLPFGMEQSRRRHELYDLLNALGFYKAYHSNPVNEAIHIVCIPAILWSAIGLFSHTTSMFGTGSSEMLDWSAFLALLYAQYYLKLMLSHSKTVGFLCFIVVLLGWVHVQLVRPSYITLGWVHGMGWMLQFWGHGVHERRAPALLENLSQALLMAPLFVALELLFRLGWAPAMCQEVQARANRKMESFAKPSAAKAE